MENNQDRVIPLLKKALEILRGSSTRNEKELYTCLSTCILAMYHDDQIRDVRNTLQPFIDKYSKDEPKEDSESESKKVAAIKKLMDDLEKTLEQKNPKSEKEILDIINKEINKTKELTGIEEFIVSDISGTLDGSKKGSLDGHISITDTAMKLTKTGDRTDMICSRILTKMLLARKFGFINIMDNDVSRGDEIYKLFSDVILNDHKTIQEKRSAADKILNDPQIDQSIKDLINSSLNNKN